MVKRAPWALAIALVAMTSVAVAQQYVYPAKGQSADKQKSDVASCDKWATQQTGFDPSKPPPPAPATAPTTATGSTQGGGARGAAKGAVVGGIMGDAGAGATAGAVAGRSQSRRQNNAAGQQQQAAVQQQNDGYAKARTACLEGKGYTVK
jgi:hypothetical protein